MISLLLSTLVTLPFIFMTSELTLETYIVVGNMSLFELALKMNVRNPDDGYL